MIKQRITSKKQITVGVKLVGPHERQTMPFTVVRVDIYDDVYHLKYPNSDCVISSSFNTLQSMFRLVQPKKEDIDIYKEVRK